MRILTLLLFGLLLVRCGDGDPLTHAAAPTTKNASPAATPPPAELIAVFTSILSPTAHSRNAIAPGPGGPSYFMSMVPSACPSAGNGTPGGSPGNTTGAPPCGGDNICTGGPGQGGPSGQGSPDGSSGGAGVPPDGNGRGTGVPPSGGEGGSGNNAGLPPDQNESGTGVPAGGGEGGSGSNAGLPPDQNGSGTGVPVSGGDGGSNGPGAGATPGGIFLSAVTCAPGQVLVQVRDYENVAEGLSGGSNDSSSHRKTTTVQATDGCQGPPLPPGYKCEPAPPTCPRGSTPLLLPTETWACISGCDMVIDYSGPMGNVRTCTPEPQCGSNAAALWREDLGRWVCGDD